LLKKKKRHMKKQKKKPDHGDDKRRGFLIFNGWNICRSIGRFRLSSLNYAINRSVILNNFYCSDEMLLQEPPTF